ncbi:hypothetical protein D9M72_247170 [compost metagenome]
MPHITQLHNRLKQNTAELDALLHAIQRECPPDSKARTLCSLAMEINEYKADHLLDLLDSVIKEPAN